MATLPPDLGEHSGSIASALFAALLVIGGAFGALWRSREREKENAVAKALEGVGEQVAALAQKVEGVADRIFERLGHVESKQAAQIARCAALHGHNPTWDGKERRAVPRD